MSYPKIDNIDEFLSDLVNEAMIAGARHLGQYTPMLRDKLDRLRFWWLLATLDNKTCLRCYGNKEELNKSGVCHTCIEWDGKETD